MLVWRWAAVMFVDVCNYTGMVAQDEIGAVKRMLRLRKETIEPIVEAFEGHIVDYAGDGALIEFHDVVLAMRCAVGMQQSLAEQEDGIEPSRRFILRIGIDLGEVLAHDHGIAGSHVNIASRLQELAAPGGICFSDAVYQTIDRHFAINCEAGGKYLLKNIQSPVDVWFFGGLRFGIHCQSTRKFGKWTPAGAMQLSSASLMALLAWVGSRFRLMSSQFNADVISAK